MNTPTSMDSPEVVAAATAQERPGDQTTASEGVVINGKRYTQAEFDKWREGFNRSSTQRFEEASRVREEAEERLAEIERREAEIAAREARLAEPAPRGAADHGSSFDEYIPGLSAWTGRVDATLSKMEQALASQSAKDAAAAKEQADASAFAKELAALEKEPYFGDGKELLAFMDESGLGLGQARIAYNALYGRREGQIIGEHEALRRGAAARPPVGNVGISPGFTNPAMAPGVGPSPDEDWDGAAARALKHPNNPANR